MSSDLSMDDLLVRWNAKMIETNPIVTDSNLPMSNEEFLLLEWRSLHANPKEVLLRKLAHNCALSVIVLRHHLLRVFLHHVRQEARPPSLTVVGEGSGVVRVGRRIG